jgi:hypothetical protein
VCPWAAGTTSCRTWTRCTEGKEDREGPASHKKKEEILNKYAKYEAQSTLCALGFMLFIFIGQRIPDHICGANKKSVLNGLV